METNKQQGKHNMCQINLTLVHAQKYHAYQEYGVVQILLLYGAFLSLTVHIHCHCLESINLDILLYKLKIENHFGTTWEWVNDDRNAILEWTKQKTVLTIFFKKTALLCT